MDKAKLIKDYFKAWLENDISAVDRTFEDECVYIEGCGLAYRGKDAIKAWFVDWHKNYKVLQWDIKEMEVLDDKVICDWYFKYNDNGNDLDFNGVSIIRFGKTDKISEIREFISETEIKYPFNK